MTRPREAKWVERADVYKQDAIAGHFRRTEEGSEFSYDEKYVAVGDPPVASTLPTQSRSFRTGSGSVPPFFAGLLPEGARLQAVIQAVETSADDELSLLLAVGADTAGDVRIVPSGTTPSLPSDTLPNDPLQVSFRELLARSADPDAEQLDSALAGVQDKLSDAAISFPVVRRGGPAILKLDPRAFPLITRNEHFFLSLARTAGFHVPRHALITDREGETGLLVERFDRRFNTDGSVQRIAQEDACQLMGRYPADKYRVSVNDIADEVANTATSPSAAVLDLALQIAFAWMIGNGDLHAKNYSLQFRADGLVTATPLYDIVSTLPYPLRQNMALRLDGRDDNFTLQYFVTFAERFGVPERIINRHVHSMIRRVEPMLENISSIGYDEPTAHRLAIEIRRRIDTLR